MSARHRRAQAHRKALHTMETAAYDLQIALEDPSPAPLTLLTEQERTTLAQMAEVAGSLARDLNEIALAVSARLREHEAGGGA